MYQSFEVPQFKATLFYYDSNYEKQTAEKIISVLEQFDFFPPDRICADKLTKNRYEKANEHTPKLFVQAYNEKDVFCIETASAVETVKDKEKDFWKVVLGLTYHKSSKLVGSCKFKPWNTLSIYSTYGRLQDNNKYSDFINCVKCLISTVKPFYAHIDDVANCVKLMDEVKAEHFVPNVVQQIYWGNYYGEGYESLLGENCILLLPAFKAESIGDGIFFTLSDSLLDFNSKETEYQRKKLWKHLSNNTGANTGDISVC